MRALLLGLAMILAASTAQAQTPAPPPPAGPVHVVTYVDVAIGAGKAAAVLLREYREATRKEAGNERSEIARELGRDNRFVVLQIWKDYAAFEAHGKGAASEAMRSKLGSIQQGPPDQRVHNTLAVAAPGTIDSTRAVFVVSHVDVPPPRKDDCIALLNPLAADSRKGAGNLRFEVVQQTTRPNHFSVVEAWSDRAAFEKRSTATPQKTFRDKLGPMLGALYDERIYKMVN